MWFLQNLDIIFFQIVHIFNLDFFVYASVLWKCICSWYLVSATPPTVLYHSHWNYTDVLTICFLQNLEVTCTFCFTFFTFLTFENRFFFMLQYYESAYCSRYLVSTTPQTSLSKCFWNFTGILLVVWGYMCALVILKLCFFVFFFFIFSTFLASIFFLLQYLGKWYRTNFGPLVNLLIFNSSNKNKAGDINSLWNLLVTCRFTCRKFYIFLIYQRKHMLWVLIRRATTGNKKIIYLIIWILFLTHHENIPI